MILHYPFQSSARHAGFTLMELMLAMGIVAVLMVFVAPALNTTLQGSQLTQAGQIVGDQLMLAQQIALAKNHAVEVRFYQFPDPQTPGETAGAGKYRALQSFEILSSGSAVPLGKWQRLPATVMIDSGMTLSSLIAKAAPTSGGATQVPSAYAGTELKYPVPGIGEGYQCASFRFRPDGTTELPTGNKWFVTLHSLNLGDNLAQAPANYVTLQIDPTNGHVRTFRP